MPIAHLCTTPNTPRSHHTQLSCSFPPPNPSYPLACMPVQTLAAVGVQLVCSAMRWLVCHITGSPKQVDRRRRFHVLHNKWGHDDNNEAPPSTSDESTTVAPSIFPIPLATCTNDAKDSVYHVFHLSTMSAPTPASMVPATHPIAWGRNTQHDSNTLNHDLEQQHENRREWCTPAYWWWQQWCARVDTVGPASSSRPS